jgi:hypothetical protein
MCGQGQSLPASRYSTLRWAPDLTHKLKTRLEKLVRDKCLAYYKNLKLTDVKSFITLALAHPLSSPDDAHTEIS